MDLQSVLLGFLTRRSMTGYDLKKAFSISFSFFSGLSYGSIYPALKKMERQGLISRHVEIMDGTPNRKVYTITESGTKAFLGSLRSPLAPEHPKSAFLMKLFFFSHLSPPERKAIALQHRDFVAKLHGELESSRPEVEARADRFQILCYQFGIRFLSDLTRNLSAVIDGLGED